MLKKIILFSLIFAGILNAANITLEKTTYNTTEKITVKFTDMTAKNQDWIGIYPKDSTNDFGKCIAWKWTGDVEAGEVTFKNIPTGEYEARAFYNNSGIDEAKKAFKVNDVVVQAASITTNKPNYDANENIVVTFANMAAKNQDWIGIYPKDSTNDFGNCIAWKWTGDVEAGEVTFNNIPAGEYEARAFYNNSGIDEARKAFSVKEVAVVPASVSTNKTIYDANEDIKVTFSNMAAKHRDWIGIYPKDSNNAFANCVAWKWTNDVSNGELTFTENLPSAEYEVRAFYNNSAKLEAKQAFTIRDNTPGRIIYETAENGFNPLWQRRSGKYEPKVINNGAQGSEHALRVRADWRADGENGKPYNHAFYLFDFQNPSSKLKYLELDVKAGVSSHVGYFGLVLQTTQGYRWMSWSSWMNHNTNGHNDWSGDAIPLPPMKHTTNNGLVMLMYPGPTDYFFIPLRNGQKYEHYKINIEAELKRLEPDNQLVGIKYFITTGVDLDNLTLDSE